jgi:hypothetical protein
VVLNALGRRVADHNGALHYFVMDNRQVVFGEVELGGGGGALDVVRPPRAVLRATTHSIPEIAKTRSIRFRSRDGERIRVVWAWAPRSPLAASEAPRGAEGGAG